MVVPAKIRFHSLEKRSKDLRGYWSFIVHEDIREKIPDEKRKTVICLCKPTKTKLYLANFGLHNKVYAQGSITNSFHRPNTKYIKVSLKDIYDKGFLEEN